MLRTTLLSLPLVAVAQIALAGGCCSDGHYNAQMPQMTEAPEVAMSTPVVDEDFAVASALPSVGLEGTALAACQALQAAE